MLALVASLQLSLLLRESQSEAMTESMQAGPNVARDAWTDGPLEAPLHKMHALRFHCSHSLSYKHDAMLVDVIRNAIRQLK